MLSSLVLAVSLSPALAADIKIKNIRVRQTGDSNSVAVVVDGDGPVGAVDASVTAGDLGETVPLAASGSIVHGTATLAGLPPSGTEVTLTVFGADSAPLAVFVGEAGGERWARYVDGCGVVCGDGSTCGGCVGDLTVDGTVTFGGDATSTHELGVDLSGEDAATVASATIAWEVSTTDCSSRLGCTTSTKTTSYEVAWGAPQRVYTGATTLLVDGAADVRIEVTDTSGATLDWAVAELVPGWIAEGGTVNALATDEDPLTSLALHGGAKELADILENQYLTVMSDGWDAGDALPTYAEVTVDGGELWEIPVHSYQVAAATPLTFKGDPSAETFEVTVNGKALGDLTAERGICLYGTCVALSEGTDGAWALSTTAYAATPDALPTSATVALTPVLGKAWPTSAKVAVAYDTEVAVAFTTGVDIVGDPVGLDLSGKVRLRGRSTLFVGKYDGQFIGGETNCDLAAVPSGGTVVSRGDILIGGEPIDIELTSDVDGDGVIEAPPAVVMKDGSGTRRVATTSGQTVPVLL